MSISASLLPEFDQEAATTRKVLERVPDDKLSFKPHPKSMSMDRLAGHLAELCGWAASVMRTDSLDVSKTDMKPLVATSLQQLLDAFDKGTKEARAALAAASDADFQKTWSLAANGKTMFTMPKIAVIRMFTMNHIVHHRAQLGVYLRLNDIPVPSMYGPSADEPNF